MLTRFDTAGVRLKNSLCPLSPFATLQHSLTAPAHPELRDWKSDFRFLLPCLAVALVVRLFFFCGPSLHDDVNYWMQIIATGLDNAWPPEPTHWHTRIGFVLPSALLLKVFGLKVWVPYIFTMMGGLLEVGLTFYVSRHFIPERAARMAAWLCVFFPLNVLLSSYLFPDLWVGLLGALSLLFWHRALHSERTWEYALASLFFGLGWLFRETVVMLGPIYLALWFQAGRWRRPKILWAVPPAVLILAGEMLLYQVTAGSWNYRLNAIVHAVDDPTDLQIIASSSAGGGFWLDPIFSLFVSHDLGLFLAAGLAVGVWNYRRMPTALVLWLVVGFVWFSWGTTSPVKWLTLQRDPRYLSVLTIPCLSLLAVWLLSLRPGLWRGLAVGTIIASGLLGAALDLGRAKLSAHRQFAASEYNAPATTAEPFVYFGVRAAQNFSPAAARFACASDLGRVTTVRKISHLPGARMGACREARYLVLAAQVQPEKLEKKITEGWRQVAAFSGDHVFVRELAMRMLSKIRGDSVIQPTPGLIVLENPSFAGQASQ